MKRGSPHRRAVEGALSREWQTAVDVGAKVPSVCARTVRAHLSGLVKEGRAEVKQEWPGFQYRMKR
jgi:hypothetical protein